MKVKKEYSATGLVIARTWGSFNFGHNIKSSLFGKTKKELLTKAKTGIKDGSISDANFQYLKGALLNLITKSSIVYEGIEYYRIDSELIFVGDLSDSEKDFCLKKIMEKIKKRLEELRAEIRAEQISYGEIVELQSISKYIEPDDIELLQWAKEIPTKKKCLK